MFLQRNSQSSEPIIDKNYHWTVLKYIKPLQLKIRPALKNSDRNTAVFMKDKETLIRKLAFPKPAPSLFELPITFSGLAYTKITEEIVAQVLIIQVATKAFGSDKVNF